MHAIHSNTPPKHHPPGEDEASRGVKQTYPSRTRYDKTQNLSMHTGLKLSQGALATCDRPLAVHVASTVLATSESSKFAHLSHTMARKRIRTQHAHASEFGEPMLCYELRPRAVRPEVRPHTAPGWSPSHRSRSVCGCGVVGCCCGRLGLLSLLVGCSVVVRPAVSPQSCALHPPKDLRGCLYRLSFC